MANSRIAFAEKCLGILPVFKPKGVSVNFLRDKASNTIGNHIFGANMPVPQKITFSVASGGALQMHKFKDYERIVNRDEPKVRVRCMAPALRTMDQGVTVLLVGEESRVEHPKTVMSCLNKLPIFGQGNVYVLHFIAGMNSKRDDGVIDERSTWEHVTTEKLHEVLQLLNLQAKQHAILGHDLYYGEDHKPRDENYDFDVGYYQKLMDLSDVITSTVARDTRHTSRTRTFKTAAKRPALYRHENQVQRVSLNSTDQRQTMPYFQVYVNIQNENIEKYTKHLATSLRGKLGCVCKLQRVERLKQFCFSKDHNCIDVASLDSIDEIMKAIDVNNTYFDKFVGDSYGARTMNFLRYNMVT